MDEFLADGNGCGLGVDTLHVVHEPISCVRSREHLTVQLHALSYAGIGVLTRLPGSRLVDHSRVCHVAGRAELGHTIEGLETSIALLLPPESSELTMNKIRKYEQCAPVGCQTPQQTRRYYK